MSQLHFYCIHLEQICFFRLCGVGGGYLTPPEIRTGGASVL